jgi:hypothetical protein
VFDGGTDPFLPHRRITAYDEETAGHEIAVPLGMMPARTGFSRPRLLVAALACLLGLVWLGKGIGLIGGSAMTGSTFWAAAGVVLVLIGIWLAWRARLARD